VTAPFQLTVFDSSYSRRGIVNRPLSISGAVRVGAPGELTFSAPMDDRRMPALLADGARVRLDYRYDEDSDFEPIYSGVVEEITGAAQLKGGSRRFSVYDDWAAVFNDWLGIPNPTGTQDQQGDDAAYLTYTGPAETVLKQHVAAARTRLGDSLTIPATAGRGPSVSVAVRMHPLADRLFPTISSNDLIVRVLQLDNVRTLVVDEPTIRTRELTQESGIVTAAELLIAPPKITRAILGAGGEGEARLFRFKVRSDWETQFKIRRERFIDARDVAIADANRETILEQRWQDALAENGPRASVSAVLAETKRWRFGKTYRLGDQVAIRPANSDALADYVREVRFDWTTSGRSIVPIVGEWSESATDKLWRAVSRSMRAQRIEQGSR